MSRKHQLIFGYRVHPANIGLIIFVASALLVIFFMLRHASAFDVRGATSSVVIASDRNFDKTAKEIAWLLAVSHKNAAIISKRIFVDAHLPDRGERIGEIVDLQPRLVITADASAVPPLISAGYKGPILFLTHQPLESSEIAQLLLTTAHIAVVTMHLEVHESCTAWLKLLAVPNARIGVISHPLRSNEIRGFAHAVKAPNSHAFEVFDVSTAEEAANLIGQSGARKIDAWYALHTPSIWKKPALVIDSALRAKIPLAVEYSHYYAQTGSLLSCGVEHNITETAVYASRLLLAGANARELTTSAASSMSVAMNFETAQKLNIKIPMRLSKRADRLFLTTSNPAPIR
jgi:ABC-type uncharacterized transport system substrate-binding protein